MNITAQLEPSLRIETVVHAGSRRTYQVFLIPVCLYTPEDGVDSLIEKIQGMVFESHIRHTMNLLMIDIQVSLTGITCKNIGGIPVKFFSMFYHKDPVIVKRFVVASGVVQQEGDSITIPGFETYEGTKQRYCFGKRVSFWLPEDPEYGISESREVTLRTQVPVVHQNQNRSPWRLGACDDDYPLDQG